MRGSEAAIDAGWVGSREWVLDTEPTDGQIQVAHKGRTWFEIEMAGVTARREPAWKGADAVAAMAEVVCALRRAFMALPVHDELGPSTITFGQIEGGYRPYVVPDHAKVWVDMRLAPPTDTAAATRMVEQAIAGAEAAVPGCHGSYTVTGDRPAIERDPSSPLLAALKRAADDVTGTDTTVGFFTGYTDTAVIAGKTGNRNCMSYGPGSLALAHKPNEYVPMPISFAAKTCSSRLPITRSGRKRPSWGIISREQTDSRVRTAHESTSVSLHPPSSGPRARGAACDGRYPERNDACAAPLLTA